MYAMLVSAIVSTYNSERFFRGCLDDLVNQSLFKKNQLEIIVIDAASQQNEKTIVEQYVKRYPNIIYQRTANRIPLYAAWNLGIKIAKGKYITNANTDDRHHPFALELLANELEKFPEVALAYPNQIITPIENQTFENCTPIGYTTYPYFDRQYLLNVTYVGHQPFWRKSLHEEFGYFREDLKIAGDLDWWLRISERYIFKHIPLLLGLYFYNTEGLERANSELCSVETTNVRKFYQIKSNKLGFGDFYPNQYYFKNFYDFSTNPPEEIKVSIILLDGKYNEETILSINSILNQTFKNFEIIVLTVPFSENKLQEFFIYDKRVKFFLKPKEMPNLDSVNLAVSVSKGEFVCFIDEYTRLLPRFLETTLKPFSLNDNLSFISFNYFKVYHKSNENRYYEIKREVISPKFGLGHLISETKKLPFMPILLKKKLLNNEILKTLFSDFNSILKNNQFLLIEQPLIEHYYFADEPLKLSFSINNEPIKISPKVSVIIPCYNLAHYLAEAVESVVNQTFKDWECIIVNDGSTDNTKEVAQNLILKYRDKAIYYYEKINEGVAIARNFGISKSKGEYILPLDADDMIHPTFLEKTAKILDNNINVDFVYTDQQHFGIYEKTVPSLNWDPQKELISNYIGITSLFRRKVWEKNNGYKSNIGYEDWEFWINSIKNGFKGYYLPENLFYHRVLKKSRYTEDLNKDQENKAKIILSNKELFSDFQIKWAEKVLKSEKSDLSIKNLANYIPQGHYFPAKKNLEDFKILAIISAFNEEDIIEWLIKDFISNGIDIYFIDDNSTDRTLQIAYKYLNRGIINIEIFEPKDSSFQKGKYNWELILKRKEEIALNIDYDWFIHADADEFFESPWSNIQLKEAIFLVDSLNFNAINFKLYNFRPYNNDYQGNQDVRFVLDHYDPEVEDFNFLQLKAWKKLNSKVDISSTGGHEVRFAGRKVFPIPFIMRHYPIRSEQHGKKKVLNERLPRYTEQERNKLWHIQYDDLVREQKFLWDKNKLIKWNPHEVRLQIFSEYSLASLSITQYNELFLEEIDFKKVASDWLKKFNEIQEEIVLDIALKMENIIELLVNSDIQQLSSQLINNIDPYLLLVIEQYLSIRYTHFTLKGDFLIAKRIRDLILLLQNKTLLNSPFINLIGYPEFPTKIDFQKNAKEVQKKYIYPKEIIENLLNEHSLEQAEKLLDEYLKLDPTHKEVLNDYAVLNVLKGNIDEAVKIWNKILEIDPNNELAKENLSALNLL